MKKRRTTVYVRRGKDVTLYVPADTPQEVIDYLNHLKEEGTFSQGVMDILARYVRGEGNTTQMEQGLHAIPAEEHVDPYTEPFPAMDASSGRALDDPFAVRDQPSALPEVVEPRKKLNLAQIFRQAQRNSGKLIESKDK